MISIDKVDVKNKKVIVRVDYNCQIENDEVVDDSRIKASLETINYLIKNEAKIILLSHLKRIKKEEDKIRYTLEPAAKCLSKYVTSSVLFVPKTRGKEVEEAIANMKNGEIVMLENTRFEDLDGNKESSCDEELSKYWSTLGDIFVLDAFASSHRNHASTYGISKYIPSYAGTLILKEKELLDKVLDEKNKTLIMGGSKVKDKIGVIDNLLTSCDKLLIGGSMSFTFLKAKGYDVSNYEKEYVDYAKKVLNEYGEKIILPVDFITETKEIKIEDFKNTDNGYDIGKETIKLFINNLKDSKLILWNGPLGKYEEQDYEYGTREVMEYLHKHKKDETILAGGDILTSSGMFKLTFPNISTGGGATLEYLSGQEFDTFKNLKD